MPADALLVHGLTADFLAMQPPFATIVDELAGFIAGDRLVIHNAEFDLAFINAELARIGQAPLAGPFVDTLAVALRRLPRASPRPQAPGQPFPCCFAARLRAGPERRCGLLGWGSN